jgi:hypothetical protein
MRIFEIRTISDLLKINKIIHKEKEKASDCLFKLMDDLDLSGQAWIPIGYNKGVWDYFCGIFDGNNHVIKNMIIRDYYSYAGFILYNLGTIQNLFFDNTCEISNPESKNAGTVCGGNSGNIIHCKSAANIVGSVNLGGICGISSNIDYDEIYIRDSNIGHNPLLTDCSFFGFVQGDYKIGGICGSLAGKCNKSTNKGTVIGKSFVGGIVGDLWGATELTDSVNDGAIHAIEKFGLVVGVKTLGAQSFNCIENGKMVN